VTSAVPLSFLDRAWPDGSASIGAACDPVRGLPKTSIRGRGDARFTQPEFNRHSIPWRRCAQLSNEDTYIAQPAWTVPGVSTKMEGVRCCRPDVSGSSVMPRRCPGARDRQAVFP